MAHSNKCCSVATLNRQLHLPPNDFATSSTWCVLLLSDRRMIDARTHPARRSALMDQCDLEANPRAKRLRSLVTLSTARAGGHHHSAAPPLPAATAPTALTTKRCEQVMVATNSASHQVIFLVAPRAAHLPSITATTPSPSACQRPGSGAHLPWIRTLRYAPTAQLKSVRELISRLD